MSRSIMKYILLILIISIAFANEAPIKKKPFWGFFTNKLSSSKIVSPAPSRNIILKPIATPEKRREITASKNELKAKNIATPRVVDGLEPKNLVMASAEKKHMEIEPLIDINEAITPTIIVESELEDQDANRLLEVVKKMTPEQAYRFRSLLESKIFAPLPDFMFVNIGILGGTYMQQITPTALNNIYGSVFGNISWLYGVWTGCRYGLDNNWFIGLDLSCAKKSFFRNNNNKFENLTVDYAYANIIFGDKLINGQDFSLIISLAAGLIKGSYTYSLTDEGATNPYSYIKDRSGVGFDLVLGGQVYWNINPIWKIGSNLSYMLGKISALSRNNVTDSAAPALNFSGMNFGIFTAFNF